MSDGARRTVRTTVQLIVALAAGLPLIVGALGLPESTAGGTGVVLAVAAAITRVMALPVVDGVLPSWLRAEARE